MSPDCVTPEWVYWMAMATFGLMGFLLGKLTTWSKRDS